MLTEPDPHATALDDLGGGGGCHWSSWQILRGERPKEFAGERGDDAP